MEQLISYIFDTLADGVLVVNSKGRILDANRAAEELTGFSRQELKGGPCHILNCSGCKRFEEGGDQPHCSLFASGGEKVVRCTIKCRSGETIPVLKRARVMKDEAGETMGAVEILTDMRKLVALENRVDDLAREVAGSREHHGIEGESAAIRRLLAFIDSVVTSTAPVLIQGESGTGKELVAQAIHGGSMGAGAPFIKVNCAALNENLLESELFGHVKGAFTGASRDRVGRFEAAHGGTLFLDEIGDMPASIQVKLLRVLEEKVIEKVGDHTPVPVDVRIITATHRDLATLVERGDFREDLYFRINVIPVICPPLRERDGDVLILANRFLTRFALRDGKPMTGISPGAAAVLAVYPWPGNIRELRNAMEYAMVLSRNGRVEVEHLPAHVGASQEAVPFQGGRPGVTRADVEAALCRAGGVKTEAARLLGVSRVTLWKWMKKMGL
ncbi:sigma-54 interaction domain-containing protein [Desulfoluna spongiiphila]|uniref:sigma-54 interaction domain-containing protein n=1 Tax=Desulfoluna spongiiphila TaxID=419481 RepID=UPI00125555A5|nr:sigma 54-interacting transcriptional regulator [Desulfoluna spongiiphila]VVS93871.1 rna polymerase sigma factor 54 interaction domain [Desulfoluna spongiiphila]